MHAISSQYVCALSVGQSTFSIYLLMASINNSEGSGGNDDDAAFQAALTFLEEFEPASVELLGLPSSSSSTEEYDLGDQEELLVLEQLTADEVGLEGFTDTAPDETAIVGASPLPPSPPQQQQPSSNIPPATAKKVLNMSVKLGAKAPFVKYNPNKARDEQRQELHYLRKKVAELEMQLHKLKERGGSKGALPVSIRFFGSNRSAMDKVPSTRPSVWREIARNQSDERITAERENIRLRLVLENQLKVAKSLEKHLRKSASTRVRSACLPLFVCCETCCFHDIAPAALRSCRSFTNRSRACTSQTTWIHHCYPSAMRQ